MASPIFEKAKEKIIIVAHRGVAGGNIPCNTIAAYNAALTQGADMIEIDVSMSRDGELFIFHPGMEKPHLGQDVRIPEMTAEEVKQLRYLNCDRTPTPYGLCTLDEVFEQFGRRCLINVDKFWDHPTEIYRSIKRHGITDNVLVKSTPTEKVLSVLRELAPDVPYMPIVNKTHPKHKELMASGINYIGAEVIFDTEDDEVASEKFIGMMHRDGKLVWANAIIYNSKAQLTAGHSDDTALWGDPDRGWSWLARRGFDFIQTDWTGMLIDHLDKNGLLYRKK